MSALAWPFNASWLRQGGIQLNSRYQTVAPISNCLYIVYIDGLQLAGNMSYSSTATTCLKHVEQSKSILERHGSWQLSSWPYMIHIFLWGLQGPRWKHHFFCIPTARLVELITASQAHHPDGVHVKCLVWWKLGVKWCQFLLAFG